MNILIIYGLVGTVFLIIVNIMLVQTAYINYKANKKINTPASHSSNKINYFEFITGIPILIMFTCIFLYIFYYISSTLPKIVNIALALSFIGLVQMAIAYTKIKNESISENISNLLKYNDKTAQTVAILSGGIA
jgi:uncharacterized BrkB/YihY/UPF0761 family membrane protein